MRIRICVLLVALAIAVDSRAAVGVRVLMGRSDTSSVQWDGSAAAQGAHITKIDPWRFDVGPLPGGGTSDGDSFTGPDSWKLATHRIRWFYGGPRQPYVANGVIVWLDGESESSELAVKTAQGNFAVRLGDIPYGKNRKLLDGRVMVDRVPPSLQITNTPDEQDYPAAAADPSGNLWLAYMEFRHHPDHVRIRRPYQKRPTNFDDLQAPPGRDQILVPQSNSPGATTTRSEARRATTTFAGNSKTAK